MPTIRNVNFTPAQIEALTVARRPADVHLTFWDRFWDRFKDLFLGVTKREVVEDLVQKLADNRPQSVGSFACALDKLDGFHRLAMLAKADERRKFTTVVSEPKYAEDGNSCHWELSLRIGEQTIATYAQTEPSTLAGHTRALRLQAVYDAARHAGIEIAGADDLFLALTTADSDRLPPMQALKAGLAKACLGVWRDAPTREAMLSAWETVTGEQINRELPELEQLAVLGYPFADTPITALAAAGVAVRGATVQRLLALQIPLNSHRGNIGTRAPLQSLLDLGIQVKGIDVDTLAAHGVHVRGLTAFDMDDLDIHIEDRSIGKLYDHGISLPGVTPEELDDVSLPVAGTPLVVLAKMGVAVRGRKLSDLQQQGIVVEHLDLAQLRHEYGIDVAGLHLNYLLRCGVCVSGMDAATLLEQNIGLQGFSVLGLANVGVRFNGVPLAALLKGGLDNLAFHTPDTFLLLSVDIKGTKIAQLKAAGFPYDNVPLTTLVQSGLDAAATLKEIEQSHNGKVKARQ